MTSKIGVVRVRLDSQKNMSLNGFVLAICSLYPLGSAYVSLGYLKQLLANKQKTQKVRFLVADVTVNKLAVSIQTTSCLPLAWSPRQLNWVRHIAAGTLCLHLVIWASWESIWMITRLCVRASVCVWLHELTIHNRNYNANTLCPDLKSFGFIWEAGGRRT